MNQPLIISFSQDKNHIFQLLKPENQTTISVFLSDWFSSEKTIFVQTSGSTGTPKTIEVEKPKMLNSAQMTCDFLGLKKGDLALLCLPTDYISGKMMLVRAIQRGLKIIVKEPSLSPLQDLTTPIDFCAMTPLQVENSLDKIHLIKNLIIGGAKVSESLIKKINNQLRIANNEQRIANCIYETYGMTETLSHIALRQIFPAQEDFFTILNGVEISQDERQCLVVNAPKLNSNKLVTNDLVELKNDREFRFLGRLDNVINSGGAKIIPEMLESLVKKTIENKLVFIGLPDEILGQKLVLVVEGKETENLKSQISNLKFEKSFWRPKEIIFIEKIPRTPNGKVNRLGLLDLFN